MSKYKLGDIVRPSDCPHANYEDRPDRMFLFEHEGYYHCVDRATALPAPPVDIYSVVRWEHIIEKPPAEYTLKGKDVELIIDALEDSAQEYDLSDRHERLLRIINDLKEAMK